MHWQKKLKALELIKDWEAAIELMENNIHQNLSDKHAYLALLYLLMNLLIEEEHDESKHDYYEQLLKKYFHVSYNKFHNDAEYCFYVSIMAGIAEWFFDLNENSLEKLRYRASQLDPNTLIYQWSTHLRLDRKEFGYEQLRLTYAHELAKHYNEIKNELISKGSLGEYVLFLLTAWLQDYVQLDLEPIPKFSSLK